MTRTVSLNGREYPLRFSVNALCCLGVAAIDAINRVSQSTGRGELDI